jgi:4-aminobutyrate aminotransferase-like enzyme
MRERGVIMGLIGKYDNLLKIWPPLVFSKANADQLFDTLEGILEKF